MFEFLGSFCEALQYIFCWRQYLQNLKKLSSGKDCGSTSFERSYDAKSHVRALVDRYPVLEKMHSEDLSCNYLNHLYCGIEPSDAYRRCKESLKVDKRIEEWKTPSPFLFLKMALSKKAHMEYIRALCAYAGSPEEVVHYLECATIRFPSTTNLLKNDIEMYQAEAEEEEEAERKAKEEYDKYDYDDDYIDCIHSDCRECMHVTSNGLCTRDIIDYDSEDDSLPFSEAV